MNLATWLRIAAIFVGALALTLLIWFGGPFVAFGEVRPFESVWVRLPIALLLMLGALGWILADPDRAARMLNLTGLTPDILRGAVAEPRTQAAILAFLEAHEPDLVAAAEHLGTSPPALVRARLELEA